MNVTLLGHTVFNRLPLSVHGTSFAHKWVSEYGPKIDLLAEFAGRSCYQSWDMPNPKTASTEGYISNIVDQEHFSVLEHATATFYVEGVSRALTHELIRHRHLSYSELSQRYVDMNDAALVEPPLLAKDEYVGFADTDYEDAVRSQYADLVEYLTEQNPDAKRKEIREAARAVMPNATETKIVVSGNLRAFRDMLKKRWHVAADAEIREFAGMVLTELRRIAPAVMNDIPDVPYGTDV